MNGEAAFKVSAKSAYLEEALDGIGISPRSCSGCSHFQISATNLTISVAPARRQLQHFIRKKVRNQAETTTTMAITSRQQAPSICMSDCILASCQRVVKSASRVQCSFRKRVDGLMPQYLVDVVADSTVRPREAMQSNS